jgi:hypothetical protein
MLGKNARKKQPKLAFGSWINNVGEPAKSTKKKEPRITLPRSVCSELQALSFADSTQPYMLDLVYQCKLDSAQMSTIKLLICPSLYNPETVTLPD